MRMMLLVHVLGGGLGLLTGCVALYATKGATLRRRTRMAFVWAGRVMSYWLWRLKRKRRMRFSTAFRNVQEPATAKVSL